MQLTNASKDIGTRLSASGLYLRSKKTAEAFLLGSTPSALLGEGMEFAQYKAYQQGDDLRMLDWKMFARSGRYFLKESSVSRPARLRLLIDNSASMAHQHQRQSKLEYAALLLASLAHLGQAQGDLVGLDILGTGNYRAVPAGQDGAHLRRLIHLLEQLQPSGKLPVQLWSGQKPYPEHALNILVSDLYQHGNEIQQYVRYLKARRQEVIVFHLLAPNELDLSIQADQLEDMETGERLNWDVATAQRSGRENVRRWLLKTRNHYLSQGVHYFFLSLGEPVQQGLRSFLKQKNQLRY